MGIFGFGKSSMDGQPVTVVVNGGNQPPQQRYDRAQQRVHNLSRKVTRLQRHEQTADIRNTIAQTNAAIQEWQKRLKIAEFELKVERGDV